ncbi:MAG: hypothetical protein AAGF11_34240 [Myxococcota bacterium]
MPTQVDVRGYTLHVPDADSNVGWARVGEVFILFGWAGKAPEDRMDQVFEGLEQAGVKTAVGASIGAIRLTSVQRKRLSECIKGKRLVTVLDHNPIARGIVTALGWFGLKIEMTHWNQLDKAVAAMGPEQASPQDVLAVLETIQSAIIEIPKNLAAAS